MEEASWMKLSENQRLQNMKHVAAERTPAVKYRSEEEKPSNVVKGYLGDPESVEILQKFERVVQLTL